MLKDLGVDIRKNTQIDKAALEVRVDASATRHGSTARNWEDSSHCYSNIAGAKAHARRHRQSHENPCILEPGRYWNQTP